MFKKHITAAHAGRLALNRYRGALRRLRSTTLDRDSHAQYLAEVEQQPVMRRFPKAEQDRIAIGIRGDLERTRRQVAAVAGFHARTVTEVVQRAKAAIAEARADVRLSMPDALDHFRPGEMVQLAILRELRRDRIHNMRAAELIQTYRMALNSKSATALVDLGLIEQRAAAPVLAADESDMPAAQQLRDYIDFVQEGRVPDLPEDFDELLAELSRLDGRAAALQLTALTDTSPEYPAAVAAYEAETEQMDLAGAATDADDQAALRAAMAQ